MAFNTSKYIIDGSVKTERGNVMSDGKSVHVECGKHPGVWIEVPIRLNTSSFFDLLNEAFDTCAGCLDEKVWAVSRFPEGAEL